MKRWLVLAGLVGLAVAALVWSSSTGPYRIDDIGLAEQQLSINSRTWQAFVADDVSSRQQGLASVEQLDIDQALVLDFGDDGRHGIWMKDMVIPIDVLWVSSDGQVVAIENNIPITPSDKTYRPTAASRYVIELNHQAIEHYGLKVGDIVDLD